VSWLPFEPSVEELLCVVGPTATGKTELAIGLCEELGGEVISADSVQVYRGFDVGSGKPTAQELVRARHHLVDVQDPLEPMDASVWAQRAEEAIAEVRARGRVPIVCGGTFLWVKALVEGLSGAPGADPGIRERLRAQAAQHGTAWLHERLRAVDVVTAERLSPNDLVRIERALEVWEQTGRPLSDWHAEHRSRPPRHRARYLAVRWDRAEQDRRIEQRARVWLTGGGWVEEVRGLIARGYGATRPMGLVGYREVREHVEGRLSGGELEGAVVRSTRIYARRQRTWIRDVPLVWIDPSLLGKRC